MIQRLYIIILLLVLTTLRSHAIVNALTTEHNMPRNGDNPTYHIISYINFSDTTKQWDFSRSQISELTSIKRYSLSGDTLISRFNGEIMTCRVKNDSILCESTASQGQLLNFNRNELVKLFPLSENTIFNSDFFSEGTIDHCRYLRQVGTATALIKQGRLITPDGDSIHNALLVKNVRYGSTIIDNDYRHSFRLSNDSSMLSSDSISYHLKNDSITFRQEINQWYARGYRYPILETREVKSYYYTIPIDSISIAYYCSPGSQSHDLASDPANEELRIEEAATSFRSNFGDVANVKSRNRMPAQSLTTDKDDGRMEASLIDDESCEIDYTGEAMSQININYTTRADCVVAVTLHNSGGALMWHTSEVAYDPQGEISYPTRDLVAGEYLVTVFLKKSQYTFKFIKK